MNIVKSIHVEGFWYDKTVSVEFFDDVNFLIGVNGSGKTTLINLLSAVLQGDIETLYKIPFTRVLINLKERPGRAHPQIEVAKEMVEKIGLPRLTYKIRAKKSEPADEYVFDEYSSDARRIGALSYISFSSQRRRVATSAIPHITSRISDLIRVSWLSIHRANSAQKAVDEETYDSSVDQKVKNISDNFVKYFASLRSKADGEIKKFQELIFLSLLFNREAERNLRPVLNDAELGAQRRAIESIFRQFKVPENRYRSRIGQHFDAVSEASKLMNERQNLEFWQILALVDHERIRSVVREWEELQNTLKQIFSPRDTFLEIINSLLSRKQLFFDERDQATVETQSGKKFRPEALSSGEKQLFILLGEVVLQEKTPYVFIADEPELSLHVSWQSKLVQYLKDLNPQMQIIFATHSPDVVSVFQDRVIPVEKYIK